MLAQIEVLQVHEFLCFCLSLCLQTSSNHSLNKCDFMNKFSLHVFCIKSIAKRG